VNFTVNLSIDIILKKCLSVTIDHSLPKTFYTFCRLNIRIMMELCLLLKKMRKRKETQGNQTTHTWRKYCVYTVCSEKQCKAAGESRLPRAWWR